MTQQLSLEVVNVKLYTKSELLRPFRLGVGTFDFFLDRIGRLLKRLDRKPIQLCRPLIQTTIFVSRNIPYIHIFRRNIQ